jgi:4-hydroxybenzoate polyprenyltransferase
MPGLFASISRFHIVAIAALGTLTMGWLFTGQHLYGIAAISALDWFIVNLLNRVVDINEDLQNGIRGTDFVLRKKRALTIVGGTLLVGSLIWTAFALPALTVWRILYHALGLVYNWRLLPGRHRLKELYFFKNTASAVGFLITVFAYPLAVIPWGDALPAGISPATLVVTATFFFLFELSYEAIYDLRDAPGDAQAGVMSYAVVHGQAFAVRLIDRLLVVSMLILAGGFVLGVVPWRIFVMITAPALQIVFYKRALRRGITSGDCIALTWLGAGLLLVYQVWIALDLPGVNL